jgi:hypothetical protein
MQDIIEDVKELFLLQSSRPYNMMRERERESFCTSIGLLTLYLLYLAPTSIVEVYPCPRKGSLF